MRFPLSGKPKSPTAGAPDGAWEAMTAEDRTIVNRVLANWGKAIAAYEYQLISVDSPFDQFVSAGPGLGRRSPAAAKRGARLFVGKAACIDCHSGPQLTDEQFHNIGVPQTGLAVPTTSLCPTSTDPTRNATASRARAATRGARAKGCGACRPTRASRPGCAPARTATTRATARAPRITATRSMTSRARGGRRACATSR